MISLIDIETFQNHFGIDGVRQIQKQLADLILQRVRESDMAGFLEDESFLVLLTQTDEEGGQIFIDHLLPALNKITMRRFTDDPLLQIKISKVAISDDRDISVEELLSELRVKLD